MTILAKGLALNFQCLLLLKNHDVTSICLVKNAEKNEYEEVNPLASFPVELNEVLNGLSANLIQLRCQNINIAITSVSGNEFL